MINPLIFRSRFSCSGPASNYRSTFIHLHAFMNALSFICTFEVCLLVLFLFPSHLQNSRRLKVQVLFLLVSGGELEYFSFCIKTFFFGLTGVCSKIVALAATSLILLVLPAIFIVVTNAIVVQSSGGWDLKIKDFFISSVFFLFYLCLIKNCRPRFLFISLPRMSFYRDTKIEFFGDMFLF